MKSITGTYRGWLSQDEHGRLLMLGEGLLVPVLKHAVARFGHDVRFRCFSAAQEFPLANVRAVPWTSERFERIDDELRLGGVSLQEFLAGKVGCFVHIDLVFDIREKGN